MAVALGGGAPHRNFVRERIPSAELVVVLFLVILIVAAERWRWRQRTAKPTVTSAISVSPLEQSNCLTA